MKNARGKAVTHHATYELVLHDGRTLRTRISRPVDRTTYGPSIWGAILKDQLEVTGDQFWACVNHNQLPDRGAPEMPDEALPLQLVHQLIHTVGIPEARVGAMSKEEAIESLTTYWSTWRPKG
ncbi:cytotoxic translational repressor of toxin-antitoxin stability system [Arthrobacter sp. PAMC25284]|uniref:cytotoxic translational repressor of toxin-antitoxin stability system n=1 Tax=Arthrobacter sp. PAMC25284 TaxID=2861279 RepID=UPI001C62F729|nr:cytotoxic translational repressor of toxin-antitoxin stability system [Arthrobacter sp. PAMC25284]QYF88463.1 cytotoxic translational repressor of toxin-antitoxin stability system [Arthrobacter sp. PAMC25284]